MSLALAESRNGTMWTVQPTPSPAGATFSYLSGVSCTSASACTAVGYFGNSAGNILNLAEGWNGTRWTIESTPNPPAPSVADFSRCRARRRTCVPPSATTTAALAPPDIGAALERDKLDDPDHSQPRRRGRQRTVRSLVRIGDRVHSRRRRRQRRRQESAIGRGLERYELEPPNDPNPRWLHR